MQIEEVSITSIHPFEWNSQRHDEEQVALIAKSIKERGWRNAILIDEEGVIICGHGRYFAALKLGLSVVPINRAVGWTEEEKSAHRIFDNHVTKKAKWDFDNLNIQLDYLEDNDYDLEAWGLDDLRFDDDQEKAEEDEENASAKEKSLAVCPECGHQFDPKSKTQRD